MSDLQNLTPANTYKGLLQVGDYTNGVDSTVKAVLDGEGTTSALAIGTTKVGINTTSPTQELDVNGDIVSTTLTTSGAVTAGSVSTSGAVGAGSIDVGGNVVADEYALDQVGSSSSAVAIHAPATNELAIRTNSTESMRIDSNGNCGIGTQSPFHPLHVQTDQSETKIVVDNSGADNNTYGGWIGSNGDQNRKLHLGTKFNSLYETHMSIDSSGNVGIGIESPNGPLHVYNTAANQLNLTRDINVIGISNGASAEIHGGALAVTSPSMGGAIGFTLKDSDGTGSGGNTEGLIYFKTKDSGSSLTEKMRIDSEGRVGIGTTGPSAKLVIQEDSVVNTLTEAVSFLGGNYTSASNAESFKFFHQTNTANTNRGAAFKSINGSLQIQTIVTNSNADAANNISLQPGGGNVGIGTVSPSAPLDVSSTTGGVIMPRMTTTQRTAISSPTPGEMVYDTDLNKFYGYTSSGWTALH